MDIRTDETDGKLIFENGQLTMTLNRQDSLRQRLQIRFKTQKFTWFLNTQYGIDWFGEVFADGTTKRTVDTVLQTEILKEPMVQSILSFISNVDNNTRTYQCTFKVKLVELDITQTITVLVNENGYVLVSDDNTAIRVK